MFPREGGDPDWAPAFAGEQDRRAALGLRSFRIRQCTSRLPHPTPPRRRPGPSWKGGNNGTLPSVSNVPHLDPGLRRGGGYSAALSRTPSHPKTKPVTPAKAGVSRVARDTRQTGRSSFSWDDGRRERSTTCPQRPNSSLKPLSYTSKPCSSPPMPPTLPTNRKTAPSVCTSYTSLHRTPDRTTIAPPPPIDDTP